MASLLVPDEADITTGGGGGHKWILLLLNSSLQCDG
jgi:hypothetical protein